MLINLLIIYCAFIHFDTWGINNSSLYLLMLYYFAIATVQNYIFSDKLVLTAIMVLCIYKKKMFKSHILVLEIKCVHSCSHTFLLKWSYYKDDHEKNIIINIIKKPGSCKSVDWFPDDFHTNRTVQCNIDEKKLPEFKYYILLNIKR